MADEKDRTQLDIDREFLKREYDLEFGDLLLASKEMIESSNWSSYLLLCYNSFFIQGQDNVFELSMVGNDGWGYICSIDPERPCVHRCDTVHFLLIKIMKKAYQERMS